MTNILNSSFLIKRIIVLYLPLRKNPGENIVSFNITRIKKLNHKDLSLCVIPTKVGIHVTAEKIFIDSRLRGNDRILYGPLWVNRLEKEEFYGTFYRRISQIFYRVSQKQ